MGKILLLSFLFWATALSGEPFCISYEKKMKDYFDAKSSLDGAIKMYKEYTSKDCADMLLAYNFIGFAYYNNSNFQKAREYYIQGEDAYSENEYNVEQFAINQMYTGLILIAERDFESAKYHLNKANKLVNSVKDEFIRATIFQNLGLLNIETGNLDEAEKYYDKAVKTAGIDNISIGYIYQNLAFLNLKRDNRKKTKEYINKTKDIWMTLDYDKGKYLLSFIEAKHSIKEKNFIKALNLLEQGRSANDDDKLLLGENYLIEAQIYDGLNNKEAQLIALENAILESDDLSEIQLKETISKLSEIQDLSKTNIVLSELVSKLKGQNLNQKKIDLKRNKIMDSESDEDQSTINMQLKYLALLGSIILLLFYLFLRINKQKGAIQILNRNLNSSKLEIENQVKKLKQKNKDLEQFAYVASHDLQSPLRTISSFAGVLKIMIGSHDEKGYLDVIATSAQNMSSMISDLLNYSTLDQKLNIIEVNFKELIDKTISTIHAQVSESNCIIRIDESCNQIIHCDKILFSNVIQNIICNSIRYCKANVYPEIDISVNKLKDKVEISFSDNGIGIEDKFKNKIFEMFTRLKTKKIDGTGIGLSTCKKIVENHKGTISVDSTLGVGSIFTLSMPSKN